MTYPTDESHWIFTPLHPEGICSTEYDGKFDKFLNPVNWESAYFTEAEFNRLLQCSKELVDKLKPLTEKQVQELLGKAFQKREGPVEILTIDSLAGATKDWLNEEVLKSKLSVQGDLHVSLLGNAPHYDTESGFFFKGFLESLNNSLMEIPRLINRDYQLYMSYLKLITKYIKGARNFNSRKARRKIRCRK